MSIITLFLNSTSKVATSIIQGSKGCLNQALLTLFLVALEENGGDPSGWTIPKWSLEETESLMSDLGIGSVILSMTAPGPSIHKDPSKAAALARETNEYAASVRDAQPDKFGFFASLPSLLDKNSTIQELEYALDTLKADGVTLFTRYGADNHYLGHPDFQDIWSELNKRSAVVFIHPTHGVDTNLVSKSLPQPMIDYPHETTRTAMDLILSGTAQRNNKCKIILSHAGGTLPYLALRVAAMIPNTPFGQTAGPNGTGMTTDEIIEVAQSFYFDLALSGNKYTLGLLSKFAKPGHILFGSDFPYAPRKGIEFFTSVFDDYNFTEAEREAVNCGSAIDLFPRFKITQQ